MRRTDFDYSNATQDDFDDKGYTEYNEGFVSYMFGHFLHENPYNGLFEQEKEYVMWYEGWNDALKAYPDIEPKE